MKVLKVGKINSDQLLTMDRAISRNIELEGGRINHNRVHSSKKTYNRKNTQNKSWA